MRPIDADRLLNERMKSKYYHLPNGDIAIPIIDIERAPTIEPKQEWIPCSERLPDAIEMVLVYTNFNVITVGVWQGFDNKWICFVGGLLKGEEPTYWMPLPVAPYEGKE